MPRYKWIGDPFLLQKCEWDIHEDRYFCHSGKCPGRIKSNIYKEGWCCFNPITGENYKPHPEDPDLNNYFVHTDKTLKNTVRIIRIKKK